MSICLTKHKKENPFCTTGRSAGIEARWRLECKRSKAWMRLKPSTSPACRGEKKTTWRPRHPRHLYHLSASVMSSSGGDWATCYSLCDTNILHYTLRHWDYWTSLSRPLLTRWLITWFLFTKYLKSNKFLTSSQISSCTKWREEKRKVGLLFKSIVCGLQVKATGELSGKETYKRLKIISQKKRTFIREPWIREKTESAGLASSHSSN